MEKMHHNNNNRPFVGIAFVAVGLFLILQQTGVIPWEIARYVLKWQMILIGIGIFSLIGNRNRTGGLIMITIGTLMYIPEVFHIDYELRRLIWPAILVVIGLIILSRKKCSYGYHCHPRPFGAKGRNSDPDFFDEIAIFGAAEPRITSQNLQGGKAIAIFGGCEISLTEAKMGVNPCVIDVFAKFGGITFIVPADWNIKVEVVSIFGGYSDKRQTNIAMQDMSKTLVIKGFVLFGGCEIKSFK